MTETEIKKLTCAVCHRPIKAPAEFRTITVLNRGEPEPATAHVKCIERDERSYARFMKQAAKQTRA